MNERPSINQSVSDSEKVTDSVVAAFNDLPVIERIKFVKNLIFDHGGAKGCEPNDPILVLSTEVLSAVIDELEKGPFYSRPFSHAPIPK